MSGAQEGERPFPVMEQEAGSAELSGHPEAGQAASAAGTEDSDTRSLPRAEDREAAEAAFGPEQLLFPPARDPKLLNPLVLAYVGDAVFEMFVRQYVVSQANHRPHHLHRSSVRFVSAKAQSRALETWMPELSEEELEIVRRGRNAKSGSVPKNADVLEYRHSTAFECLIGYLYYMQRWERLRELIELIFDERQDKDQGKG